MDVTLVMPEKMFVLFFKYYYCWDTFCHQFKENTEEDTQLRQLLLDSIKTHRLPYGIGIQEETGEYTFPRKIKNKLLKGSEKVQERYLGETLVGMLVNRDYHDKNGAYPPENPRNQEEHQEIQNAQLRYKFELSKYGISRLRLVK